VFTKHCLSLKHTQNKRKKAFPAKNIIHINNVYFWAAKNFRFSCVCAHRHITFANTSGLFNGDRLINVLNFTSPSKIHISGNRTGFETEIQKIFRTKKAKKYIKFPWSRVSTARSVHVLRKCHSNNKIIPRDTCVTLQTKIIRDNQKSSGFANKIAKIIEIWIKRSVKQFLKSKSTFKNSTHRERERERERERNVELRF